MGLYCPPWVPQTTFKLFQEEMLPAVGLGAGSWVATAELRAEIHLPSKPLPGSFSPSVYHRVPI